MGKDKKFTTVRYEINSEKLKKNPVTFAMISDLHNVVFGRKNELLLQKIKEEKPDAILIAGDLVLGKPGQEMDTAYDFLAGAVKIAPVFYALGNHEQRMKLFPKVYGREYFVYEKKIKRLGVTVLENEYRELRINGEQIRITGLLLPYHYYEKIKKKHLEKKELDKLLGKTSGEDFEILLAHTPKYAEAYSAWGGDLILSGHYHGGMVRIPFLGGVISPDFRLFPKYSYGHVSLKKQHLIVGGGLGEHTIPLRIWNPRELIMITCAPQLR